MQDLIDRLSDRVHDIQRDIDHATTDTPENCARVWMLTVQVQAWRFALDAAERGEPCPLGEGSTPRSKIYTMALNDAARCWRDT
jgi:hypothetical protein